MTTEAFVRKYSVLASVIEKRTNPLLNNKGRIERRVFAETLLNDRRHQEARLGSRLDRVLKFEEDIQ